MNIPMGHWKKITKELKKMLLENTSNDQSIDQHSTNNNQDQIQERSSFPRDVSVIENDQNSGVIDGSNLNLELDIDKNGDDTEPIEYIYQNNRLTLLYWNYYFYKTHQNKG